MTETHLVRACLDYLRRCGWWAERLQAGSARGGRMRMARKGAPDIVAVRAGGRALLIECKLPGGRVRPEQYDLAQQLIRAKIPYYVIRDVRELESIARWEPRRGGEG